MMPCERVKLADGTTAIVCSGRRRQRKCPCGNNATLECDFPHPRKASGTCDKPLCRRCAISVGPDLDHCPDHPREQPQPARAIRVGAVMAKKSFPRAETTVAGGLAREDGGRWFNDSHRPPLTFSGGRLHELKCSGGHYQDIRQGRKRFEIRFDDRRFCQGDFLALHETELGCSTGNVTIVKVLHLLRNYPGIAPGYVVMSIDVLEPDDGEEIYSRALGEQ